MAMEAMSMTSITDQQDGDEQCWDTDTDAVRDLYVRLAKAAAESLGVTL